MLLYWLLFIIPVSALLLSKQYGRKPDLAAWRMFCLLLILIIGLRDRVGGDWGSYLDNFLLLMKLPAQSIFLTRQEPAYAFFSYLSGSLGLGIYGVNLACAAVFVFGLADLCRRQPYPWLAMAVAVPYLVVVVAMGYTRQAAALGALMLAVGALSEGKTKTFLLYVVLGAMFHKTALVLAGLLMFKPGSGIWKRVLGIGVLGALIFLAFLAEEAEHLYTVYVENTRESQGGLIRVALNAFPAVLMVLNWRRWAVLFEDRWLWGWFALLSLLCLVLVSLASTAVDRMALYLIPVQIVVWARCPWLIDRWIGRTWAIALIVAVYGSVEFVWLNFGDNAQYWLPYRNVFFPEF